MKIKIKNIRDQHGQAMVEFALALPIILLLVFGLIEFGYLLFSFSSVNSASRDAARYGIAIGDGTVAGQRYYDCQGIVNAGLRIGRFAGMDASDFLIVYDAGPGSTNNLYDSCASLAAKGGVNDGINFGDRIKVTVNHDYTPIAALMGVPIQPFTMTSTSTRTIVKEANIGDGSAGAGGGGGGGGGGGVVDCHFLTRDHTGEGGNPTVSPTKSTDCELLGQYEEGEALYFTASPNFGWSVGGWSGTDSDGSTSFDNTVSMPAGPHTVGVTYIENNPTCYPLSLSPAAASTGTGADPTANPSTANCPAGEYPAGETITINAAPDEGNEVGAWIGTTNNSSRLNTNTVLMPASPHSAQVVYILSLDCFELTTSHVGNGIDPIPSAPNCEGTKYSAGTVVHLTATPEEGYEVAGWSGTNFDASTGTTNTVTMNADKSVSVTYESETVLDPPASVAIPNGDGDWHWNSGTNECQKIDLRWAYNSAWSPETPVHYQVFRSGASHGTVVGTHWDADFSISVGTQITLGVRAVFAGGETSKTQEVTYACFVNDLVYWGSVVK